MTINLPGAVIWRPTMDWQTRCAMWPCSALGMPGPLVGNYLWGTHDKVIHAKAANGCTSMEHRQHDSHNENITKTARGELHRLERLLLYRNADSRASTSIDLPQCSL